MPQHNIVINFKLFSQDLVSGQQNIYVPPPHGAGEKVKALFVGDVKFNF